MSCNTPPQGPLGGSFRRTQALARRLPKHTAEQPIFEGAYAFLNTPLIGFKIKYLEVLPRRAMIA